MKEGGRASREWGDKKEELIRSRKRCGEWVTGKEENEEAIKRGRNDEATRKEEKRVSIKEKK